MPPSRKTGVNPAPAIAAIINAFENLNVKTLSNDNFALLTPVHIKMGEKAYGISAGSGEVHFTIRTKIRIGDGAVKIKNTSNHHAQVCRASAPEIQD